MNRTNITKIYRRFGAARCVAWAVGALLLSSAAASHAQVAPTPVRDVDNAARQPFQRRLLEVPILARSQQFKLTDVPTGKRLVIEHASLHLATFRRRPALITASLTTNGPGIDAKSPEMCSTRLDVKDAATVRKP